MVGTMIFMVVAIIIDALHVNSASYRYYADKIDMRDDVLEENDRLRKENAFLRKTNKEHQKIIGEFVRNTAK